MSHSRFVQAHYHSHNLAEVILERLHAQGKDTDNLTVDDLANVDAFHLRGRQATQELCEKISLTPDMKVLDIGCGIGGSARFLADRFGCHVTGIDLTQHYIDTAAILSRHVDVHDHVHFMQGSALALPLEDNTIDVVWTEHTQMNIEDKALFYSEIFRVLKPGGQFLFHDIFLHEQQNSDLIYPVPWATSDQISHLIDTRDVIDILTQIGFEKTTWTDTTEVTKTWFENRPPADASGLTIALLMGKDAKLKLTNLRTNIEQKKLSLVQAVMTKRA